jgi:prepilin-type N-terminal cleavage/methylation domain-containing protein
MKAAGLSSTATPARRFAATSGFTIIELLVASAIGVLIVTGAYFFLIFSLRAMAGVSSQSVLTQTGGNTIEVIQKRVRFATTNFVSSTGNTLTLGFDDDPTVNADGIGRAYDDTTHFEQFKFIGVNSTNATDCKTNQLIYIANTNSTTRRVLISSGVRNLPGYKIFSSLTNSSLVIIRFGIADPSSIDHYQAIDLQGTGVSLNRLWTTNVISIYP